MVGSERVKDVARNRVLLIVLGILTTLTLLYQLVPEAGRSSTFTSIPVVPGSYGSAAASNTKPFELEGVTLGRPFSNLLLAGNATERAELLTNSLMIRFNTITETSQELVNCSLWPQRYSPILQSAANSRGKPTISMAINLYNSEAVLPSQAQALLTVISLLRPQYNVYVSIYENGSTDRTREMLGHLAAALALLDVNGLWIVSSNLQSDWKKLDRITLLEEIRNEVLRPLIPYAGGRGDTLLFINDILFCASGILELILQRQVQNADAVAGNDWDEAADQPKVYDQWVHRGINGDMTYPHNGTQWLLWPNDTSSLAEWAYVTQSPEIHQRWLDSRPFPVYSAWGGMVAFNASLFTEEHLRFRSSVMTGWTGGGNAMGAWGKLVGDETYMAGDCPGASECKLLMRDIWNLRHGKARIVMAPLVNTAYNIKDWNMKAGAVPFVNRGMEMLGNEDTIDWDDVEIPKGVVCIPSRTESGDAIQKWAIWGSPGLILDPLHRPIVDEDEAEKSA